MKNQRKTIVLSLAVLALMLAGIVAFVPNKAYAQSGNKQYVSITCNDGAGRSWSCNDCNAGNKNCFDHTCSQCDSGGGGPIQ
jgi:hypothetical protein